MPAERAPLLLTSYRPIALTSSVCKLAERLILARLAFVAKSRGLVHDKQVGFSAKRSAEDSIAGLYRMCKMDGRGEERQAS